MKTYTCTKCGEEWGFVPQDYNYKKSLYPKVCPWCQMGTLEVCKDIYREEGFVEAIKYLFKRLLRS